MFVQARNTEFAGDETQRPQLTDDEKFHVAIHEAGHALVATLRGHEWLQVTINGIADSLGFLDCVEDPAERRRSERQFGYLHSRITQFVEFHICSLY